ncbi:hypothetical protein J6590_010720 [Homalodisca vitripennis]|nr:hypothetical protein J6590_010720 [Homalodisca vitripennis]
MHSLNLSVSSTGEGGKRKKTKRKKTKRKTERKMGGPSVERRRERGLQKVQVEERRPGMTDKSGGGCVRRPVITETSDDDELWYISN